MPAGDLSPDQARYVDLVTKATGLDNTVVMAWVGQESGWGANKAGHNYLNVGPGRTYPSTEQAAANAAGLVNASDYYAGIRAAIPAGPAAQIKAIGESPWGTIASRLTDTYTSVLGKTTAAPVDTVTGIVYPAVDAGGTIGLIGNAVRSGELSVENVSLLSDLAKKGVDIAGLLAGFMGAPGHQPGLDAGQKAGQALAKGEGLAGAAGAVVGNVAGDLTTGLIGDITGPLLKVGLTMVFTVAALAVLSMAMNRLTGVSPLDVFKKATSVVGAVAPLAAAL